MIQKPQKTTRPPMLGQWILERITHRDCRYSALGDFQEIYDEMVRNFGHIRADIWYWRQVFKSIPPFLFDSIYWSVAMFSNYIKITIRNLVKYKLNSILNISGLAVGIACSLLIFYHIKEELSYDKHFPKADRIYRLTADRWEGESWRHWALVSPVHGQLIQNDIPEIEKVARFRYAESLVLSYTPAKGEPRRFEENGGFCVDPEAIDIFDLHFIFGDPQTALDDFNSIVLTTSLARKYFGKDPPLSKTIFLDDLKMPLKVTGVIDDVPQNTHLQFDFLLSMPTFYMIMRQIGLGDFMESRSWAGIYTYVLLQADQTQAAAEAKLPAFLTRFYADFGTEEEILANFSLHLQPITDIHLHSKLEQELSPNSDIAYIYIFASIAIFVLLIAGVNFVNITTAQALRRMKEVGVRKLFGAPKIQLVKQFLGESLILTYFAAAISLLLLYFSIPFYNGITGKNLEAGTLLTSSSLITILAIITLVGMLAGIYPAFFISDFQPVNSLKGMRDPGSSAAKLRKGLVVFQIALSVFIIFTTLGIYQQMRFLQNKDLGFDREHVLALKLNSSLRNQAINNADALKTALLADPTVLNVSVISNLPGERFSFEGIRAGSMGEEENAVPVRILRVDESFVKTLGIDIVEGRDFAATSRHAPAFILNEIAARDARLENPVGKVATDIFRKQGEIVGVAKNFHFSSLHSQIEPLVIEFVPPQSELKKVVMSYILVRIQGSNIADTIEYLKTKVAEFAPNSLFIYSFLDDNLNRLYKSELRMKRIFQAFALFAILISCLGLFGLSVYSAELRVKEIGVRKVLGATISRIVVLLSKDFVKWVILANMVALPIGWLAINFWLQNFAYRIDITILTFLLALFISLIVAIATVSYQALKAALANPVEALKYE